MSSLARKLRRENKTIGFVPTMGALHEGHLSLVREARQMCDIVIVSIFVNPKQFGEGEDFEKYPRDLTSDAALLTEYHVDYIFTPCVEEIYPDGFGTYVEVAGVSNKLEGELRPGHFRGVATVLAILFNTIRPDYAFFGQKDAQQTVVVKRLTRDLGYDTEIVVLPIVREESGLALSSRNAYLSAEEKLAAAVIYQALRAAKIAFKDGERSSPRLIEIVWDKIQTEPLARIDYIAVLDSETFEPVDKIDERQVFLAVAVRFGKTRLLDNTIFNRKQ